MSDPVTDLREIDIPVCRHCLRPMGFITEGKTVYLYSCENRKCPAWHNSVEVLKSRVS